MVINSKGLTPLDLFLIQQAAEDGHNVRIRRYLDTPYCNGENVHVNGCGFGDWFVLAGYCLPTALIQADCLSDALEGYLEEHVQPDDLDEDEWDEDCGTFDSVGEFYSERTLSLIHELNPSDYRWEVELTPHDDYFEE